MTTSYQLVQRVPESQIGAFPTHIVISSKQVTVDMSPLQLRKVVRGFVDVMFSCLADLPATGNAGDGGEAAESATTPAVVRGGIYLPVAADNAGGASSSSSSQASDDSGRRAIVETILRQLEDDFLPLLMHGVDEVRREAEETGMSEADVAAKIDELSPLGALFTKRGELQILGTLESCGFGVAGVFINKA